MATIYIGTSGFSYKEWVGGFYPKGLKSTEFLPFYAGHFKSVELNNTFYRLPSAVTIESWKASVGPDFRFAVKASQRITHRKDFGSTGDYAKAFFAGIAEFGDRLGPLLFQFPPFFGNPERLAEFIASEKAAFPQQPAFVPVMEFRNEKLLNEEVFAVLRGAGIALCCNDAFLPPEAWPEPSGIAYLRLRNGPYARDFLKSIAEKLRRWSGNGVDCYVFFKHEEAAPEIARMMLEIMG